MSGRKIFALLLLQSLSTKVLVICEAVVTLMVLQ